jgi:CheY-like chemotaxis protein
MMRRTPVEICAVITNHRILKKTPVSNVLVIDDEEVVPVTVTKMLERLGFTAITAKSGRGAADSERKRYSNHISKVVCPN